MNPGEIPAGQAKSAVQAELVISQLLRFGVLLCASLLTLGLALRFFHTGSTSASHSALSDPTIELLLKGQSPPSDTSIKTIHELKEGLFSLKSDSWITLGLLVLIFLPIARVALTVFLFLFERDWVYLVITLVVLSTLLIGIIFGKTL